MLQPVSVRIKCHVYNLFMSYKKFLKYLRGSLVLVVTYMR